MVCFPAEGATQHDVPVLPNANAFGDEAGGLEAGGADVKPNNEEMRDLDQAEAAKEETDDTAGNDASKEEPAKKTAGEVETVTLPRPAPKATAGAPASARGPHAYTTIRTVV